MSNVGGIPLLFFCDFSIIYNVLINIHEYLNKIICMLIHLVNRLCLGIKIESMFSNLG